MKVFAAVSNPRHGALSAATTVFALLAGLVIVIAGALVAALLAMAVILRTAVRALPRPRPQGGEDAVPASIESAAVHPE